MTGFRVSQHRTWRNTNPRHPPQAHRVHDERGTPAPPPFHQQLLMLPARAHNKIFGRLEGRRPLFLTTRFLLVLLAVLLILQGVSGSANESEVGDFHRVTEPTPVQAYLAPGSTHKYPIEVAVGQSPRVTAFFTQDHAVIRLPSMGDDGRAYGLQITVRHDQSAMDVALMVAQPREGFRSVPATLQHRDATQFESVRFAEAGEYGVLVRSTQGVGSARIMVSVVQAPVESTSPLTLNWLPLISGAALGTVLAGPYLPGAQQAQPNRTPARPLPRERPEPKSLTRGYAHLHAGLDGATIEDGHGASAEEIAARNKRGWVIRIE